MADSSPNPLRSFFSQINFSIILGCIDELLQDTDESCLECMCKLLETTGARVYEKARERTKDKSKEGDHRSKESEHFEQLEQLSKKKSLPSRIRFMIQDIIDLRKRNWVERRKEKGPMTIDQVHSEINKEKSKTDDSRRGAGAPPGRGSTGGRGGPVARASGGGKVSRVLQIKKQKEKEKGKDDEMLKLIGIAV